MIVKLYMMILYTWPSGIPSGGSVRGLSSIVIHRRLKNSSSQVSFLFQSRVISVGTLDLPEGGRSFVCVTAGFFLPYLKL